MKTALVILIGCVITCLAYWMWTGLGDTQVPLDVIDGARRVINVVDRSIPLKVSFSLHNPSHDVITLKRVKTSCSCVSSVLGKKDVNPNESTNLTITINKFDSFSTSYKEVIVVESSIGKQNLVIEGSLPTTNEVLYRPHVLVVDPRLVDKASIHTIVFRVPRECSDKVTENLFTLIGATGDELIVQDIEELQSTLQYKEYRASLTVKNLEALPPTGAAVQIRLTCGSVVIPIEVEH